MHSQEVYMAPETDKTQVVLLGFTSFFLQLVMSGINLALVYYLRETYKVSASAIGVVVSTLQISYVYRIGQPFIIDISIISRVVQEKEKVFISFSCNDPR